MRIVSVILLTLSIAFLTPIAAQAGFKAQYNFETGVPSNITASASSSLQLSPDRYKDGEQSLLWSWSAPSELTIGDLPAFIESVKKRENGIMLWIYNPKESKTPLKIQFVSLEGKVEYTFDFGMDFKGWRACWMRYMDMKGDYNKSKQIVKMVISTPEGMTEGKIYLDRLTISKDALNAQVTPDKQIPTNNSGRRMWHWGRLWEWEQFKYDIPRTQPDAKQKQMLATVEKNLSSVINIPSQENVNKMLPNALKLFEKGKISPLADGGTKGGALVSDDESTPENGDLKFADFQTMLWAFALDAKVNNNTAHNDKFFLLLDHMIDQGFDVGSAMGTNHHYGYQTRNIYTAAWLMRDEIAKHPNGKKHVEALSYWSGLGESRQPYEYGRDETLDSWNTLLLSKIISSMMQPDDAGKLQEMKSLSRWVSGSMEPSPGTVGGIKVDGTTFHHGGLYPAYTIGAMSTLGQFCKITRDTEFIPTESARKSFKLALQTMRNYTNTVDWGLGIAGRHPMNGFIPISDINAFGQLAVLGDLTGSGKSIDHELAADYLRLKGNDRELTALFKKEGVTAAAAPEGFFVYNYGALGIHRRDNWMVTLKAYNSDVWCAETYTKDNRYGRYQSYGTAPIIGSGNPVSAKASGFVQAGWDWNRAPGATTIHLPFEMLDSPNAGTLMEKSPERFSGASSLEGKNGVLAFKLKERDRVNFTKDAQALKSIFCFDNRMVFLGSDITNSNASFPTETTLFQLNLDNQDEQLEVDEQIVSNFPMNISKDNVKRLSLSDTKGNFYIVKNVPNVTITKQKQSSPNDKTRTNATGNFASAYINHGNAPQGAKYEYIVCIQPTSKEINKFLRKDSHEVIRQDNVAHIVKDMGTGITAYVAWRDFSGDKSIKSITGETIVMERMDGTDMIISVCTPDLGIDEKTYSTPEPSKAIVKSVTLEGRWELSTPNKAVKLTTEGSQTTLTVSCIDGIPVEMRLKPIK